MVKTLRDFVLNGGILGKSFICGTSLKNFEDLGFFNKPYKVEDLSCFDGIPLLDINFYGDSKNYPRGIHFGDSLNDLEATKQQIDDAERS